MNATVKALRKKLNELQEKEASLYEQYDSVRLEKAKCLRDFTKASNLESKENLQKKLVSVISWSNIGMGWIYVDAFLLRTLI